MTTQEGQVLSVSTDSTSTQYNGDEVFEDNNNIDKPTINHVHVDCYITQPASDGIAATNVLVYWLGFKLVRNID